MREKYIVEIDRPSGVLVGEMKAYIKTAIEGWSGGGNPDSPLFGHFHDNEIKVHRQNEFRIPRR